VGAVVDLSALVVLFWDRASGVDVGGGAAFWAVPDVGREGFERQRSLGSLDRDGRDLGSRGGE
jgi:hypothetical protein